MRTLLIIALVAVVIIAVVMLLRPSGPRITTIEHRDRREDNDEDRDDA
ncbi:MAG TPA: hypothetical protein VNH53_05570 [Sphingomicrobium sp.]|jgi:preprotein translocase subunit SecG|nr:hypothetical protein [Sphingomicrobium sp.]